MAEVYFDVARRALEGEKGSSDGQAREGAIQSNTQVEMAPRSSSVPYSAVIIEDLIDSDLREIAENAKKEHDEEQWSRCANGAAENRVLARIKKGYYVLGPELMAENNIICVLYGGKLPFCFRPWKDRHIFLLESAMYTV